MVVHQVSIAVLTGHTLCILLKKRKLYLGLVFVIFVDLYC